MSDRAFLLLSSPQNTSTWRWSPGPRHTAVWRYLPTGWGSPSWASSLLQCYIQNSGTSLSISVRTEKSSQKLVGIMSFWKVWIWLLLVYCYSVEMTKSHCTYLLCTNSCYRIMYNWFQLRLNISCCVHWKFMLWKMQCFTLQSICRTNHKFAIRNVQTYLKEKFFMTGAFLKWAQWNRKKHFWCTSTSCWYLQHCPRKPHLIKPEIPHDMYP